MVDEIGVKNKMLDALTQTVARSREEVKMLQAILRTPRLYEQYRRNVEKHITSNNLENLRSRNVPVQPQVTDESLEQTHEYIERLAK